MIWYIRDEMYDKSENNAFSGRNHDPVLAGSHRKIMTGFAGRVKVKS
jgi:hypothetical protein